MFPEPKESKSDSDRLRQSPAGETTTSTSPTTTSSPSAVAGGSSSSSSAATAAAAATLATKVNNHSHQHNHQNNVMQSKTSYSAGKQQAAATALHQHYLNYFNSNIPREETKSQQRARSGILAAQDYASYMNHSNAKQQQQQRSNHNTNQMNGQQLASGSGNSNHIYQTPSQMHGHLAHMELMSRSVPTRDESPVTQRLQQLQNQTQQQQQQNFHPAQYPPYSQPVNMKSRSHSTGALSSSAQHQQQHQNGFRLAMLSRHEAQQQDRDSEETTTTTIKEELENDLQGCKTSELEAISSLERNLPIELSFLIRQQAHCMARMNYLDRQIRELKDSAQQSQQQVDSNQVSSTSILNPGHMINRPASNIVNVASTMPHTKNGNFILSDDSGGEYSRATLSDDDELSSLLDQIAKSVRPERASGSSMVSNNYGQIHQQHQHQQQQQQHQQQQQQRLANNCGTLMSNKQQPQQPYAIINANQLHHQQAVPIFVMSSPIAVAHPSSISSNILPGVHFQPEPRYNQYYEDLCYGNNLNHLGLASSMVNTPTMAMQRHPQQHHQDGQRAQQFDNSISVIEQLVSQREKRQIMSQLKSADNWLKMRSSNQESSIRTTGSKQQQQQQQQQLASMNRQMSADTQAQELEEQQSDIKR